MKLVKGSRRASLPGSNSTISLSPSNHPSLSSVDLASASTTQLDDFNPPPVSPRKSLGYSRKGKEKERHPPTSFSLGRALSFGRRKRRENIGSSSMDEMPEGARRLEAERLGDTLNSNSPLLSPPHSAPIRFDQPNRSPARVAASLYLQDRAHHAHPLSSTKAQFPSNDSTSSINQEHHPTSSLMIDSPRKLVKRKPVAAIHEGVVLSTPWNGGYTEVELESYRPQPSTPRLFTLSSHAAHFTSPEDMPLPLGAEASWITSLERNSSASSSNSARGPSTDESAMVQTPLSYAEGRRASLGQAWDMLDGQGDLSRSDSYTRGDDEVITTLISGSDLTPPKAFLESRPPSPTDSNTHSNVTHQTSSSSSTAKGPPLKISTSIGTFGPWDDLVQPSTDVPASKVRHRPPPLIRLRSASLGGRSTVTSSVYSVGEVTTATEGIVTPARIVQFSSLDEVVSEGSGDIIEKMKQSSNAIRRAFELEEQEYATRRSSLTLRRPPPPPHLASGSTTEDIEPEVKPKRPELPTRSSSLTQLWRRLSSSKRKSDVPPTPPKRQSSLFVPAPDEDVPRVPSPVSPVDIKRLTRKASKGRMKRPTGKENIPAVPPIPVSPDTVGPGLYIAARNSSLVELPVAATPLLRSPPLTTLGEGDYFTSTHHRPSVTFESPETLLSPRQNEFDPDTREKRRKCRQTLVEIKDDAVFQRVLEDLAQLQTATPEAHTPDGPVDMLEMRTKRTLVRSPSKMISERKTREESIRAWFVTREIVQGERRHGRLLARGVTIVRGVVEPASLPKATPSVRHKRGVSFSEKAPAAPSLGVLLEHLPRLLAVSLTLSSRFEHDPSPMGVALAFQAMEEELSREIGLWAGEVGNLIAMGLAGVVDKTPGSSRQASMSELNEDPDDRLGLADIIMTPITRALRYKLLFKELLDRIPQGSKARDQVESALSAADRIAIECDKRQVFDLDDLRRKSRTEAVLTEGKSAKRRRPKSVGLAVVQPGNKSWLG